MWSLNHWIVNVYSQIENTVDMFCPFCKKRLLFLHFGCPKMFMFVSGFVISICHPQIESKLINGIVLNIRTTFSFPPFYTLYF